MDVLETKSKYGLTINLHDFSQAQFEEYQPQVIKAAKLAYTEFDGGTGVSASSVTRGETVRAAVKAGFLTGVTVEEIGELKPYVVEWLADQVRDHVKKVTTAPTDPN
jgi:acetate kinase